MRLLMSGGGTGGHVYPLLAVEEALRVEPDPSSCNRVGQGPAEVPLLAEEHATDTLYVGGRGSVEESLAKRAGLAFEHVQTGQLRGRAPWVAARNATRMARGLLQSVRIIRRFMPDIVLVTGGYVCAPVILAARLLRKPVVVYLPDVTPGLAVRLLSRFAARVAVTCHEAARYFQSKAVVTGYPTRAAVTKATSDSAAAKAALGLEDGRKTVLVFGGSRGAVSINRALQAGLPELLSVSQVLHITGTLDWPWVSKVRDGLPPVLRQHYHPFSYLHEEMALALAAADLAVSRAGAATLGEYTAAGLPSVLVPYPHAGRHQDANARYLARHGAAEVLDDSELLERLLPTILRLLNDDRKLQRMGEMALTLAEPCAAQRLAALLRAVAQGRTPAQASSGG